MKAYQKWAIGLSLLFALVSFTRLENITPERIEPGYLAASLIFLVAGFVLDALLWRKSVGLGLPEPGYATAIAACGLSIFGKYIPGKVWALLGRVAYISDDKDGSYLETTYFTAYYQILMLFGGCTFGAIFFAFTPTYRSVALLGVMGTCLGLFVFHYTPFRERLSGLLSRLSGTGRELPALHAMDTVRLLPWSFLPWLAWGIGFYFLMATFRADPPSAAILFAFPFAGVVGMLTLVSPGGIGVRESILTGLLVATGSAYSEAASLSVFSRIWFLFGEIAIFAMGATIHYSSRWFSD